MSTFSKRAKLFSCLLALAVLIVAMPSASLAQTAQPAPGAGKAAPSKSPEQPAAAAPAAAPATNAAGGDAGSDEKKPAEAPPKPPVVNLPPELAAAVDKLAKSVEQAEKSTHEPKTNEAELVRVRAEVEAVINDSRTLVEKLKPPLAEVVKQIEGLGPPPAKDQPPEAPPVAAERARLNATQAAFDGAIKTVDLASVRAKQVIDRVTVMRYQLFTRNLLERRESPVSPEVWSDLGEQFPAVYQRLKYYTGDWMLWASRVGNKVIGLLAAVVVIYFALRFFVRRFISRRMTRPNAVPSFFERVIKAAWVVPLRMLAPAAAVTILFAGLKYLNLLYSPWESFAVATYVGLLFYIAASALLTVSLAPGRPAWRLVPVADRTARSIARLLKAFVGMYLLDIVCVELGRVVYAPLAVTVAQSLLTSVVFALLIAWLVLTPFVPQSGPDRAISSDDDEDGIGEAAISVPLMSPLWIKLPLAATSFFVLVSSLLGYVALGRFVAHQVVLSGTVLAAGGLLYLAVRAATQGREDDRDFVGQALESRFGFDNATRRRQLSRLIEALATVLIALAALPLLMVQWGFSGADVRDWLKSLLFGFDLGGFHISLARILLGLMLFVGLLFLTRVLQRWLRDNVLVQPRVDPGIANSVDTAVGYTGIGLALLIALSYGGLDITSLAIVAGALSVGIGFGLQSIVNNFVSGLILLVERPVKVGDWIVVGDQEGNVRRISVRSTEIETFDRANLIIPNSELIMGRVQNWTHRNQLGRAVVKVATSPTADPEQVMKLLLACADEHPLGLKVPGPFVMFDDFTAESLRFTLGVVVADVYTRGKVGTELRVAILKRFREHGIQLVHAQHDVHLKDLGWIKTAVARVAEQQRFKNAQQAPMAPGDVPENWSPGAGTASPPGSGG